MSIEQLSQEWLAAKAAEKAATDSRRNIEDSLFAEMHLNEDVEGTENYQFGAYQIKVVGRMTRKVDGDMLQDIAAEHNLVHHISTLFRWKPEINATAWKSADSDITRTLSGAITTTPSRPSFTITTKE